MFNAVIFLASRPQQIIRLVRAWLEVLPCVSHAGHCLLHAQIIIGLVTRRYRSVLRLFWRPVHERICVPHTLIDDLLATADRHCFCKRNTLCVRNISFLVQQRSLDIIFPYNFGSREHLNWLQFSHLCQTKQVRYDTVIFSPRLPFTSLPSSPVGIELVASFLLTTLCRCSMDIILTVGCLELRSLMHMLSKEIALDLLRAE